MKDLTHLTPAEIKALHEKALKEQTQPKEKSKYVPHQFENKDFHLPKKK